MNSCLEEEVRELRVSIDLNTKAVGMLAESVKMHAAVSANITPDPEDTVEKTPEKKPAAKKKAAKKKAAPTKKPEPKEEESAPVDVETVRSLFTRLGKGSTENRTVLRAMLDRDGFKRLDDVPAENLPALLKEATALESK